MTLLLTTLHESGMSNGLAILNTPFLTSVNKNVLSSCSVKQKVEKKNRTIFSSSRWRVKYEENLRLFDE